MNYLTTFQAAAVKRVSDETVRRAWVLGKINGDRIGGRLLVINDDRFQCWTPGQGSGKRGADKKKRKKVVDNEKSI